MRLIVTYDVETTTPGGKARLRKVAKACKSYGVRVQYSVFECSVTDVEGLKLRRLLLDIIDSERDSLRIYSLCEADAVRTEHHGVRAPLDVDGPLIV